MATTSRIVTLTDKQAAYEVSGLKSAVVYVRVRKVSSTTVPNGTLTSKAFQACAFEVDKDGASVTNSLVGEGIVVGLTHHTGLTPVRNLLAYISKKALQAFIAAYQNAEDIESVPDLLPLS